MNLEEHFKKPWCLIDNFFGLNESKQIESNKFISYSDFFLLGHFKNYSVYPGILIVEGMKQTLAIADRQQLIKLSNYFLKEIQSRFIKPLIPGDTIHYSLFQEEREDKLLFKGVGKVRGSVVVRVKLIYQKE
jgi:3-hydroxyacyl-[acyl-carrier-protein] dehydratase